MAEPSETCMICIENFNKVQRKKVKCQYCGIDVCRICYQKYCLSQRQSICMNCKKVHSLSFFANNVTAVFLKGEWNDMMKVKLFENEQAKFPATQAFIEELKEIDQQYEEAQFKLLELQAILSELTARRRLIIGTADYRGSNTGKNASNCVLPCPKNGCNGLILRNYKCGICDTKVCRNCNDPIDDEDHKCDPDKVKSVDFIRNTTKPCPKCATRIHRIEGCDQMFCTMCHTAFSYKTGNVETGRVHNPHYFEYLRSISPDGNIRREVGDAPNGGCCNRYDIPYILNGKFQTYPNAYKNALMELYRRVTHIEDLEMRKYNAHTRADRDVSLKERDLRVKFMQGKITRPSFELRLRKKQRTIEKCEEVFPILETVVRVVTDMIISLPSLYDSADVKLVYENIAKLVNMANESLQVSEKTLKTKLFRITPELEILRDKKEKKTKKPLYDDDEAYNDFLRNH